MQNVTLNENDNQQLSLEIQQQKIVFSDRDELIEFLCNAMIKVSNLGKPSIGDCSLS